MASIVGRELSPSNTISWVPADGSFPIRHCVSGNRLRGALALLAGCAWVSFFFDDIRRAWEPTFPLPEFLMMVLVALPGVFILLYGLSGFVYFEETIIDPTGVTWKRRGLRGNCEWREVISNYKGVLKEHQYWDASDTSRGPSHMIYFVRLVHSDSAKDVVLFRAESSMLVPPAEWLEEWKRYAKLLQMPVLEKTETGMSALDINDLYEPLINKIRDGKAEIIHIDPLETKLGLWAKLEREDDLWILTCYPVWNAWKSIAGIIILTVALLGSYAYGLINPQLFKYFLLFIPVCMVAIGLSIHSHVAHPEQLALDKKYIYYRHRNRKGEWVTDDLPLHSICNISVKSNPMHFRSAGDIVIEERNRSVRFGWWLPRKTKLRIRSLLLSLVAHEALES